MSSDPCNIWHSKISTATKIRLYNVYILPVLLYGAETWTLTKVLSAEIDSFDQWCQRRILRLHYSQHVSNHEVRRHTDCILASEIIQSRRLKLFGHTARADVELDHHRALRAAIQGPPPAWRRPPGRPRQTWTRTICALRTSDYIPLDAGHRTALPGRNSWGQLRPAQGHATDDDDPSN